MRPARENSPAGRPGRRRIAAVTNAARHVRFLVGLTAFGVWLGLGLGIGIGGGCTSRKVRVATDATGAAAARTFAANELGDADLARLRTAYASEPVADSDTGGRRVAGEFGGALPSELGNRNGLSELRTSLGAARFYYEAMAEPADEWRTFRARMDAGELWLRLFGAWSAGRIEDGSRREEWSAHVEETLVPLVGTGMMMYSAAQASVQSQRIGARIRDTDDFRPMSDDERFRQRTFLPLLMLLGERGILEPGELQKLLLLGNDGNASAEERKWAADAVILPAIVRQVQRFNPEIESLSTPQLVALGFGFLLWVNTPSEARDAVLLASPAISDDDKARIRAGGMGAMSVSLPPPYGVDPRRRAKPTEVDVRLRTGARPWLTNGEWDEKAEEVVFKTRLFDANNRTIIFSPVFFANWSEPDAAEQERLFGATILADGDLADYCLLLAAMPEEARREWDAALATLGATGDAAPMARFAAASGKRRPLPRPLVEWIAKRAGPSS
jgi:hypothetical protein